MGWNCANLGGLGHVPRTRPGGVRPLSQEGLQLMDFPPPSWTTPLSPFLFGGRLRLNLGPPVVPFYPFWGEGSPTKIDYRKKGTLILSSLVEDLVSFWGSLKTQPRTEPTCYLRMSRKGHHKLAWWTARRCKMAVLRTYGLG